MNHLATIRPSGANKKGAVKAELLQAAIFLLKNHGQAGATARAICSHVGVKQPALYHHYGQLQGLHLAAVNTVFQQAAECYQPASDAVSPLQSIRNSWQLFSHFAKENPQLYRILNEKMISGDLPESVAAAFTQLVADLTLLSEQQPLLVDPVKAAQLLWAGANGVATLLAASHNNPAIDETVADLMLDALLAQLVGVGDL